MPSVHPSRDYPGFRSWKNDDQIKYTRRWLRYALVSLLLDPDVIAFKAIDVDIEGVALAIQVTIRHGDVTILYFDAQDLFAQIPEGIGPHVVITRADIMAEPRFTTVQTIWARARTRVPEHVTATVVAMLRHAPDFAAPLSEVVSAIGGNASDGFNSVAALAVRGVVTIDMAKRLGPQTLVSLSATRRPRLANRSSNRTIHSPESAVDCRSTDTCGDLPDRACGTSGTGSFEALSTSIRLRQTIDMGAWADANRLAASSQTFSIQLNRFQ